MSDAIGQLSWECVGHKPTRWVLGFNESGIVEDAVAEVVRLDGGKWNWRIFSGPLGGVEPSREEAIKTVDGILHDRLFSDDSIFPMARS